MLSFQPTFPSHLIHSAVTCFSFQLLFFVDLLLSATLRILEIWPFLSHIFAGQSTKEIQRTLYSTLVKVSDG